MERTRVTPIDYGVTEETGAYCTIGSAVTGTVMRNWSDIDLLNRYNQYRALCNAFVSVPSQNFSERIVEDRSVKLDKKRFNKVWHGKTVTQNYPYLAGFASKYGDARNGFCRNYYRAASVVTAAPVVEETILHDISTDQFKSRAWASMQPRFQGDVSIINTLFELKDFRDVAKYLMRNTHYFDAIRNFRRQFYRKRKTTPWFDPTVPASKAILTWNLAIMPTIRDISAILLQMNSIVMDEQRKFAEAGKTLQTTHYSEVSVHSDDVTQHATYPWLQTGSVYKTRLTATLKYTYSYKMRKYIDAFRRYWGLTGSIEAFWNMVPITFLLDYIVQVGKALHAVERDPNVDLLATLYGESYKISHATGSWFHEDSATCCTVVNGHVIQPADYKDNIIAGVSTSIYHREVATPFKGMVVPKIKTPSARQLLNMASLARLLFH